jgi:uncharacterized protein YacL
MKSDTLIFKLGFVILLAIIGFLIVPLDRTSYFEHWSIIEKRMASAVLASLIGFLIILFEIRVRKASLKTLIGAAIGSILGLFGAFLLGLLVILQETTTISGEMKTFLTVVLAFFMGYVGLVVGAAKGEYLDLSVFGGLFSDKTVKPDYKILDTSVIIDGRIADVAETGFLSGTLVVPDFILRELQQVADSPDSSKRQRGRRGLDMLQRLRNNSKLDVQIIEADIPKVKEVDLKLIELAKELKAVIVTNDFNLNKISQLHGVQVLNINELANALKPVVLPGEKMQVFILKEGKEYNQGVGYLEDGTMVVVDNARKIIGRNADVVVTSVLQTTAGKMIFGKLSEENGSESVDTNIHDSASSTRRAMREQKMSHHISEFE